MSPFTTARHSAAITAAALLALLPTTSAAAVPAPTTLHADPRVSEGCLNPETRTHTTIHVTTPDGTREYVLSQGADPHKPRPLVVSPHYLFGDPEGAASVSGLTAAAERGLVIVYPRTVNGNGAWQLPATSPDMQYVITATRDALQRACIDPTNVSLAGFSQGAMVASVLACTHPELYPRGFVAVAGIVNAEPFAPGCPGATRAWAIHGTDDPVVQWDGTLTEPGASIIGTAASTPGTDRATLTRDALQRNCATPIHTRAQTQPWGTQHLHYCGRRITGATLAIPAIGHTWPSWTHAWVVDRLTN